MRSPAQIIGLVSGKGGVGKSSLAANLAVASSGLGAKVLLVDGDLGLANMDLLLGLSSPYSVVDVLNRTRRLEDAVTEGPRGIELLPAASGRSDLTSLEPLQLAPMLLELFQATERYDLILLDIGAGLGQTVLSLAAACDRLLLVTTPEPTSLADAYAMLKTVVRDSPEASVELIVNRVLSESSARTTHDRLSLIVKRFLGRELPLLGYIPEDTLMLKAVARQKTLLETHPRSDAAREIVRIAANLVRCGGTGMRSRTMRSAPPPGAAVDAL